jgi:dTDP-4-dehydrorhamnose 3,5-epimerase
LTSRFEILDVPLSGLRVVVRKPFVDARGYLERMFCSEDLSGILAARKVAQVNRTLTRRRGTVRGMHFQYPPHAEMKLVSCLRGEVFDVAVDLRRDSPTFLRWRSEVLSEENGRTLVIPEGFAHGFQALTEDCELLYFHTTAYHPEAEGGLNSTDPRLAIEWPLPIADRSERDSDLPFVDQAFEGLAT